MGAPTRLKIWPDDLEEIRAGRKRSEVRRVDDRKFLVGDVLELQGYDPQLKLFVGRNLSVRITHVERMAGPIMICGFDAKTTVPLVVLSIEVV